jgi:hypothetical protein
MKYHILLIVAQWISSEINEVGKCTSTIIIRRRRRKNKLLMILESIV